MRCASLDRRRAFTQIDLLAVLPATALLAGLLFASASAPREKARRLQCANNLRQVAQAYTFWMLDQRTDSLPFRTTAVPSTNVGNLFGFDPAGGTTGAGLAERSWFQFFWIQDQLGSPKVLVCPGDTGKVVAVDFSANPEGGLLHPAYQNNAVSYLLGLDATYLGSPVGYAYDQSQRHLLASDRHLRVSQTGLRCSAGVTNAAGLTIRPSVDPNINWTNAVHGPIGQVAAVDTSVTWFDQPGLRQFLPTADGTGTSLHLLAP